MSIEGPSKVDINTEDQEDGTCKVTYCPTEPGNYIINIKFADQHVPGIYSQCCIFRMPYLVGHLLLCDFKQTVLISPIMFLQQEVLLP